MTPRDFEKAIAHFQQAIANGQPTAQALNFLGVCELYAGNRPAAQVDAFDARAIDPDLAPRHGRRKARNEARIELERERFLGGR